MLKLLLVDDDALFLSLLSRGLRKQGIDVTTADSGSAALTLLDTESFNVVLSDVSMPGGPSGIDVFHSSRNSRSQDASFFFITGHSAGSPAMEGALAAGAAGCLEKPVTRDQIFALLQAS